jgi:hypothetical protein|tara:strand:- start:46 stop:360 length:315 start_codon:yes stop_codon:yes gene_type:complete
MPNYKMINGQRIQLTAQEETEYQKKQTDFQNSLPQYKLKQIKNIRLQKLQETDWWVLRGTITDEQKNYRQKLRDIPADYDSSKYDELLAIDSDGKLTHSVWKKP